MWNGLFSLMNATRTDTHGYARIFTRTYGSPSYYLWPWTHAAVYLTEFQQIIPAEKIWLPTHVSNVFSFAFYENAAMHVPQKEWQNGAAHFFWNKNTFDLFPRAFKCQESHCNDRCVFFMFIFIFRAIKQSNTVKHSKTRQITVNFPNEKCRGQNPLRMTFIFNFFVFIWRKKWNLEQLLILICVHFFEWFLIS